MTPPYTGRLRYATNQAVEPHVLHLAILCRVGGSVAIRPALLDTGSEWAVLSWALAESLGYEHEPGQSEMAMLTRFGRIQGWMARESLQLRAEEGTDLEIEATWFVSPDWPGPTVLGWRGCLDRFRFGLEPREEWFCFAPLFEEADTSAGSRP